MRLAAKITPWRENWEQDPAVTFKSIAEEVGCSAQSISNFAMRHGWTTSEAVVKARRQLHFVPRAAGSSLRQDLSMIKPVENTAWPSIWAVAGDGAVATGFPERDSADADAGMEEAAC
jgi:hypothetical protein